MTDAPKAMTWKQIRALDPCGDAARLVRNALRAKIGPDYAKRELTLADAVSAGVSTDNLIWLLRRVMTPENGFDRRMRLFATDCAA